MWFCGKVKQELADEKTKTKDLTAKVELHRKATNDMTEQMTEWNEKYIVEHLLRLNLEEEVTDLSDTLARRFKMPDFTTTLEDVPTTIVDPPNEKSYDNEFLGFQYDITTGDDDYYALDHDIWSTILEAVFPLVKRALKSGKPGVADCENFSRLTKSFVSIGVFGAGFDKEVALANASGRGHGYIVYMTTDKRLWVWEPQSATLLGEITDDIPPLSGSESYDTRILRF